MCLLMEINNGMIERLVDTGAFMLVMAASIIQKLGIIQMVSGHKTYKTTFRTVTIALGRLDDIHVHVGNVVCNMVFLVVDINTYDLLLGLDFLMKIGVVVDVEKGTIQVRHGHGANVEMLPLNVVNIVQHGETQHTSYVGPIKSLGKMFNNSKWRTCLRRDCIGRADALQFQTILMMKDHLIITQLNLGLRLMRKMFNSI